MQAEPKLHLHVPDNQGGNYFHLFYFTLSNHKQVSFSVNMEASVTAAKMFPLTVGHYFTSNELTTCYNNCLCVIHTA